MPRSGPKVVLMSPQAFAAASSTRTQEWQKAGWGGSFRNGSHSAAVAPRGAFTPDAKVNSRRQQRQGEEAPAANGFYPGLAYRSAASRGVAVAGGGEGSYSGVMSRSAAFALKSMGNSMKSTQSMMVGGADFRPRWKP